MTDQQGDELPSDPKVVPSGGRVKRLEQSAAEENAPRPTKDSTADAGQSANPYASPQVLPGDSSDPESRVHGLSNRGKSRAILGMIVTFAASGFLEGMLPAKGPIPRVIDLTAAIVFALLVLRWYEWDRWENEIPPWRYFALLVVVIPGPLFMVPIYLLSTRGSKGLWPVAQAAALLAVLMAVTTMTIRVGIAVSAHAF